MPAFFGMRKLGWHHDRIRPLYRGGMRFFQLNIKCYDKDMNYSLVLTREQDHRLKVLKKREMIYRLEADMENHGIS